MTTDLSNTPRVRPTKQARSQRTLERILVAAEALVLEKGLAHVSIPDIVARAGSSVGGFYARFKDKNALLRALEERQYENLRRLLDEVVQPARWQDRDLIDTARGLIHVLVETVSAQRGLIEAILFRAGSDPSFREHSLTFRRLVTHRVTALFLSRQDEISHPDPAVGIDLATQAAFSMMLQHVAYGGTRAAGRELSRSELETELTRLVVGLLGGPPIPALAH
jgi:AcrR family transcriptional regulator